MVNYRLSATAKSDLIRIHHFGVMKFGMTQADIYFESFFTYFELIAERPYSYEAVDFIRPGYRRSVCGSDSIYFRIQNNSVEIITIIGRQDLNTI
jgi:toxin ParE1/3/4